MAERPGTVGAHAYANVSKMLDGRVIRRNADGGDGCWHGAGGEMTWYGSSIGVHPHPGANHV
jgi:hypothetical protein